MILLLCASAALFVSAIPAPQEGQEARLTWRSLDGKSRQTPLEQAPGTKLEDWMGPWMSPEGLQAPEPVTGDDVLTVEMLGGDRLFCKALGGDGGALTVSAAGGTELSLSIEQLAGFECVARRAGRGNLQPAPEGDRLYRLAGRGLDRVDGVLVGFDPEGVRFEGRLGEKLYPWAEVVGLFIESLGDGTQGSGAGTKENPVALVEWTDGSRMRGRLVRLGADAVVLAPIAEFELLPWTIPMAAVRELVLLDGSFRFLPWQPIADAGPSRSPFDPPGAEPLGMVWPHRIDRGVTGDRLLAGGRTWTQGIGVHAPSHLSWNLDGADCRLMLMAGLDDSARRPRGDGGLGGGTVEFRVLVDGEQAWTSGVINADSGVVQPDPIDLSGAKTLELVVTDGGDGPVLDRANWLRPLLVGCE
ncbi:MAG: NPCBM/NEW2 domain-containing protein [Planctomycetota bacterium]|nr:NPCBM/NEW2 domain-containing protein [Planctomycetota bacterium]